MSEPSFEKKTDIEVLSSEKLKLGINASKEAIKQAYRKMIKKYHPDRNNNNPTAAERFEEVHAAYKRLTDDNIEEKYPNYNQTGSQSSNKSESRNDQSRPASQAFSYDIDPSDMYRELPPIRKTGADPKRSRQRYSTQYGPVQERVAPEPTFEPDIFQKFMVEDKRDIWNYCPEKSSRKDDVATFINYTYTEVVTGRRIKKRPFVRQHVLIGRDQGMRTVTYEARKGDMVVLFSRRLDGVVMHLLPKEEHYTVICYFNPRYHDLAVFNYNDPATIDYKRGSVYVKRKDVDPLCFKYEDGYKLKHVVYR